jgi:hypothetical protein
LENRTKTVNSSRRPTSIRKEHTHFRAEGRKAKFPVGPTSPNPIPMLPRQRKEAATLEKGSRPLKDISTAPMTPVKM